MAKLALALLLVCAVCPVACRAQDNDRPPVLKNQNEIKPNVSQCHYGPGEYHWTPTVSFDITKEGLPAGLMIIHSTGDHCIDEAAMAVVRQYLFKPATTDKNKPIKSHLLMTVNIDLVVPDAKQEQNPH